MNVTASVSAPAVDDSQVRLDRLSELAREEREQVALALVEARPGIGVDWLPHREDVFVEGVIAFRQHLVVPTVPTAPGSTTSSCRPP